MENWETYRDLLGRKVYKSPNYKIVLGRSFRNFFARSWIGYKFVDGRYRYACAYFFEQFNTPDDFIDQLNFEYNLPCNKSRQNKLYRELNKD